jgi:alpha-tubulin suppressor-like RCC1 family protein
MEGEWREKGGRMEGEWREGRREGEGREKGGRREGEGRQRFQSSPLTPVHIIDIVSGEAHSMALGESGKLWAFGCNKFGQVRGRRKGQK